MDQLNKLRLLAGLPIKQPAPRRLNEARAVPKTRMELAPKTEETMKARVMAITAARKHIASAITALEQIPAVDFMGDVPHLIEELSYVLNGDGGEGGLDELATMFQSQYRSWKRSTNKASKQQAAAPVAEAMGGVLAGEEPDLDPDQVDDEKPEIEYNDIEGEDPDAQEGGEEFNFDLEGGDEEGMEDPNEFAELSADADADAFGAKGAPDTDAVIDALKAGFAAGGEEGMDDRGPEEFGAGAEGGLEGEVPPTDDEDLDPEMNQAGPLDDEDPGAVGEEEPGYGEDDGKFAEFDESAKTFFDKPEGAAAVPGDKDKKVKVPPSIKQQLRDLISQTEADTKFLKVNDRDARWFDEAVINACQQLLTHLEAGLLYDIRKAQIYMTSLMGPILHKLPPDVVKFIARGGEPSSVSDFMKPVDKKFPVTGKVYKPTDTE